MITMTATITVIACQDEDGDGDGVKCSNGCKEFYNVPGTGLALSADPARLCQQRHENKNELDAPQPARKKDAE